MITTQPWNAWGKSWGYSWDKSWGYVDEPVPTPSFTGADSGTSGRKRKKRDFEAEKRERLELRRIIEQAIDPLKGEPVKVVASDSGVAIVPRMGPAIAMPAFPNLNFDKIARSVVQILDQQGIEARRARDTRAQAMAEFAFMQAEQERNRKIMKRRRDDEFILLMGD